ncbi:MAG: hypothetical protein KDH96_04660 [Candidatus Riesia sp.]|nr:hypothetical protein [Candidatus Riesia sp.]
MITKVNGYTVELIRQSNYLLYDKIINDPDFISLTEPEVPKFWSESKQAWLENPMSAEYNTAVQLFDIERNKIIVDIVLNSCVKFNIDQIDQNIINKITRTRLSEDINLAILKYVIFRSQVDVNNLIKNVLLTEHLVYKYITLIDVTRNGIPILEHKLRNPVNSHIEITPITIGMHELVNPIHEYNSCVESNLNWDKWLSNEYTLEMMAYTIAMYRLNKLIEVHQQDEQTKK